MGYGSVIIIIAFMTTDWLWSVKSFPDVNNSKSKAMGFCILFFLLFFHIRVVYVCHIYTNIYFASFYGNGCFCLVFNLLLMSWTAVEKMGDKNIIYYESVILIDTNFLLMDFFFASRRYEKTLLVTILVNFCGLKVACDTIWIKNLIKIEDNIRRIWRVMFKNEINEPFTHLCMKRTKSHLTHATSNAFLIAL